MLAMAIQTLDGGGDFFVLVTGIARVHWYRVRRGGAQYRTILGLACYDRVALHTAHLSMVIVLEGDIINVTLHASNATVFLGVTQEALL